MTPLEAYYNTVLYQNWAWLYGIAVQHITVMASSTLRVTLTAKEPPPPRIKLMKLNMLKY